MRCRARDAADAPAARAVAEVEGEPRPPEWGCTVPYEQLPAWLRDNDFITAGYRGVLPTARMCLRSLGFLHNETGNILTHAGGSALFVALAAQTMAAGWPAADWLGVATLAAFWAGAIVCMGLSALFHLFFCQARRRRRGTRARPARLTPPSASRCKPRSTGAGSTTQASRS